MRTHEHLVLGHKAEADAEMADWLDQMGEQGWELVTLTPEPARFVFRRPVIEGRS